MSNRLTNATNDPALQVLDNAAWHALCGPHAGWAERSGAAARYDADATPFAALPDVVTDEAWSDMAHLAGPGGTVVLFRGEVEVPDGWTFVMEWPGVQLVAGDDVPAPNGDPVEALGPDDVGEMLDLVARTKPGPFLPRTVELGRYVGVREHGRLIAMAGERMRPAGFTEVSAVCTAPEARGRGLASELVRVVAAGIRERGDVPFIQALASNVPAIRIYEQLGFVHRRTVTSVELRAPEGNA